MQDGLSGFADRQALVAHLDERFANGDIERALGGFALMVVRIAPLPDADINNLRAAVAAKLTATLRDTDFLATFDPNTFAVVLPQISDRATASRVAEKLQAAFSRAPNIIGATISASLFPEDGTTRDALIAHAMLRSG
jgi:GGDEF domain-containing protein